MGRLISPSLSVKRAIAGRKGGYARFFSIKSAGMAAMGRLGGRPRLLTLEEIQSQVGARENINSKARHSAARRSSALPGIGRLELEKRRGGPAASALLCSPGRSAG